MSVNMITPIESWTAQALHRNMPFTSFKAEKQILEYWDDPGNEVHYRINPFEYNEEQFRSFVQKIGKTTGEEITRSSKAYCKLMSGCILKQL